MSASTPAAQNLGQSSLGAAASRFVRRNSWVLTLWGMLGLLLVFTILIKPDWGAPQLTILAIAALPYAFATAAQTMAVLVGGIDLSVAAMMTFTSVTAAVLMEGRGEEFGAVAVVLILLMGLGLGAINGLSIVLTRVPDIVVTLSFFFIWEGAALMVLDAPGGSSAAWLRDLIIGPVGGFIVPAEIGNWLPKALLLLVVSLGVVWVPLKRSRLGLSIYAVGSDRLAAFRSGVPVDRTKVAAYALAGLFAAMGGLDLDHEHGHRDAHPGPLSACQRGGRRPRRREPGRRQGWAGGTDRGRVHPAARAPGPDADVHRPQRGPGHRRPHHGGGRPRRCPRRASGPTLMSGLTGAMGEGTGRRAIDIRATFRDRPLIPLVILLFGLIVVLEFLQPGIVNERWVSNIVRAAVPLAILAAAQTLTMLTGGIDLSVGIVATMTAFVMATQVSYMDPALAIPLALAVAALVGLANGIGVGIFRVHPLIMTLAVGLVVEGLLLVYQRLVLGGSMQLPEVITWLGTGRSFGNIPNSLLVFIPLSILIWLLLRRTGFGRLLYAIGDNEGATRLAGVRYWQVIIVLYILSALLAGIGGLLYIGLVKANTLSLAVPLVLPSVAAAVIGGTSIYGGRGGYAGTIVGALILQVITTLLLVLQVPEGTRRIIFGLIILGVTAAYTRITEER